MDLFGWVGASSTWTGLKQYGITSSTATNAFDGYGKDESESLKSDWGTLMGTGWFTLSKDQWDYLLSTRTPGNSVNGTSNARYTQAAILTDGSGTIGLTYNIHGIILFPDNASLTSVDGVTWSVINAPTQWPSGTTCTTAGWTALQEAGCVFLPAAGFRTYDGTYNCGLYGYYWSSSPYTNPMKETVANAYALHFGSLTVSPTYDDGTRNDGYSVRLVTEAAPAPTPGPTTTISDDASGIESAMAALIGEGPKDITINRTLYKDGYFNTLCLPFSLNASELAASPLAGCQLYSLSDASYDGDNLYLTIAEESTIEAGKPYLIKWLYGSDITSMTFTGVTVTASTGSTVTEGGVRFVGTIGRSELPHDNADYLFLGANDNLYYSAGTDDTSMKGFRAYFIVNSEASTDIPRHAPARLVIAPKMPTGMDNVQGDNVQCTKVIENGQLYIMYKGTKYNVQGKVVK
ncbi:MAG: hypothetical protein IJ900_00080 [Paludibacteraceae bacterium]|nr:hypothetical protein [Paludibacteraceae bacterium]